MVLPEAARLTMRMKPTMLSGFVLRLFPLLSIQSQVSSYCVSRIAAYAPGDGADASRWPSCEWSRPAFGPQAASHWRLIRRPVGLKRNRGQDTGRRCTT